MTDLLDFQCRLRATQVAIWRAEKVLSLSASNRAAMLNLRSLQKREHNLKESISRMLEKKE